MNGITVYVDGLCEPKNPGGTAAYGFAILRGWEVLFEGGGVLGSGPGMTSNVAEYAAVCEALKYLLENGYAREEVTVRSDSRLVVNQMTGRWGAKGGAYFEKYLEARKLASEFPRLRFEWIPREMNTFADYLSRRAYCRHEAQEVVERPRRS